MLHTTPLAAAPSSPSPYPSLGRPTTAYQTRAIHHTLLLSFLSPSPCNFFSSPSLTPAPPITTGRAQFVVAVQSQCNSQTTDTYPTVTRPPAFHFFLLTYTHAYTELNKTERTPKLRGPEAPLPVVAILRRRRLRRRRHGLHHYLLQHLLLLRRRRQWLLWWRL